MSRWDEFKNKVWSLFVGIEAQLENARRYWPAIATGLVLVGWILVWHRDKRFSAFSWIEVSVLVVIGAISTQNYRSTIQKIKEATNNPNQLFQNSLTIMNMGWFVLASGCLFIPEWHILAIVLIFATFSLSNVIQLNMLTSLPESTSVTRKVSIVEGAVALRQENGPAVLAYALVIVVLAVITWSESAPNLEPLDSAKKCVTDLKVFAGGAAAFHLTLSVLRYFMLISKDDVVEITLRSVDWNAQAEQSLQTNVKSWLVWWKWLIGVSVTTSFVVASMMS